MQMSNLCYFNFNLLIVFIFTFGNKKIDTNFNFTFSLLFKRVRGLLGGRIRFILAGGAPLAPETHRCLRAALCCPVLQVRHHSFNILSTNVKQVLVNIM